MVKARVEGGEEGITKHSGTYTTQRHVNRQCPDKRKQSIGSCGVNALVSVLVVELLGASL